MLLSSRGTTLIAAYNKPPLNGIKQFHAPITEGIRILLLKQIFQSISSGVYLHIRQHLLAPTAVSLDAGIHAGHAELGHLSLRHCLSPYYAPSKRKCQQHFSFRNI